MYRIRTDSKKFILPILWLLLLGICLIAPYFPQLVAKYYTQGLFRYWTIGLRFLFGWLPFAIGEIIYVLCFIALIINTYRHFTSIKNFNTIWHKLRFVCIKFAWLLIKLYVVFQFIWGLNYVQPNAASSYYLTVYPPKNAQIALDEINVLTNELIQELNQTKAELNMIRPQKMDFDQLCLRVQFAYSREAIYKRKLKFQFSNFKKAVFPSWGDYIGYLAFYQPITGEAIVRSDLPVWTQPYTMAHEMAHQLGYASETDANFIAYVVAAESGDPILRYSMLLQMFSYAQDAQLLLIAGNKGFSAWEAQIKINKSLLSPDVLKDRADIRAFFVASAGKQIEASTKLYDQFLKWNQQAAGLASYADVLKWVRAYRLKTDSSTSYSR